MEAITIRVPNNWLDFCSEASISDTLAAHSEGTLYRKASNDDECRAWLEACVALNIAKRQRNGTIITVSIEAAKQIAKDLHFWGTLRDVGLRSMITAEHARQCMKAYANIQAAINEEAK
jgi:hypothetical protein